MEAKIDVKFWGENKMFLRQEIGRGNLAEKFYENKRSILLAEEL